MSLKHVQPKERLQVSLGYLQAVRNRIAAGDIPTGQPLYPNDVVEYLDEILKARTVIDKQAEQIAELEQANKDLNAKINRDNFATSLRESTVRMPDHPGSTTDFDPRSLVVDQSSSRLSQLSNTIVNKGVQHAQTQTPSSGLSPEQSGATEYDSGTEQGESNGAVQHQAGQRKRSRASRVAPPEPDWDDFG